MIDFEELFLTAAESTDEADIRALLNAVNSPEGDIQKEKLQDGMELLVESWGGTITGNETKARVLISLAILPGALDTPAVGNALQKAFAEIKTTSLANSALMKATGIRSGAPLLTAVERFETLNRLAKDAIVFNPATGRLGTLKNIDGMAYEMTIRWDGVPADTVIPIDAALDDLAFIENAPPADSAPKISATPKSEYLENLTPLFISPFDETTAMRFAASQTIPSGTEKSAFEAWWNGAAPAAESTAKASRHFTKARSLREFREALENASHTPLPEHWKEDLRQTLATIKIGDSKKDAPLLAESLALLAKHIGNEDTALLAAEIKNKIPFWPENPKNPAPHVITAWSAISAANAAALAQLTAKVFSNAYLAELLPRLPYKILNAAAEHAETEKLIETLEAIQNPSADVLLWIWRNKKADAEKLIHKLTPGNLVKSIDANPKNAGKELAKLLLDDSAFQNTLLDNAKGAEHTIIEAAGASTALQTDEKQSLLVKLAAKSEEVKKLLESGRGRRLFAAHAKSADKVADDDTKITSIRSYSAKAAELEDIATKQIPENSKAIAHARSYGDLRENAEYKAAKERQAFLSRRHAEIERELAEFKPIDFAKIEVEDVAIPGTTVTIEFPDASTETYQLLGAWDGNPEENRVSHISGLGKVLDGTKKGDTITLPDKRTATVANITPIPAELAEHLGRH
jgi:transcription elongation GreA/GreB family factor